MRSENDSNSLLSYRWSQGENRKRKINFDQKFDRKRFLSEEKMIKGLQALSLDLSFPKSNDQKEEEDEDEDEDQPRLHLHHILENNLKRDPFQDGFIDRLYGLECKKLSMQIVPYMPVYPGQLPPTTVNSVNTSDNQMEEEEEARNDKDKDSPIPVSLAPVSNDDHLFKRPFTPPAYTVEEPCDTPFERSQRMKRSYSQSLRSNSNLTVVELKNDENDLSCGGSKDDYFIVEPCTPILCDSLDKKSQSNTSTTSPSINITEYFDFFPSKCSNRERSSRMEIPLETNEIMEADTDL